MTRDIIHCDDVHVDSIQMGDNLSMLLTLLVQHMWIVVSGSGMLHPTIMSLLPLT